MGCFDAFLGVDKKADGREEKLEGVGRHRHLVGGRDTLGTKFLLVRGGVTYFFEASLGRHQPVKKV